jgi:hypothetical protein
VWRKTDGTPQGYNTWRGNFGAVAGGGGSIDSTSAVPEPTAWCLFVAAALCCQGTLRRCYAPRFF